MTSEGQGIGWVVVVLVAVVVVVVVFVVAVDVTRSKVFVALPGTLRMVIAICGSRLFLFSESGNDAFIFIFCAELIC